MKSHTSKKKKIARAASEAGKAKVVENNSNCTASFSMPDLENMGP